MVKNKYYKFYNEDTKNSIEDYLNKKGYYLHHNTRINYNDLVSYYEDYNFKNNIMYIETYYNNYNKKHEYIYTCAGIIRGY